MNLFFSARPPFNEFLLLSFLLSSSSNLLSLLFGFFLLISFWFSFFFRCSVKYVRRNNLLLNGQPPTLSSSSSTITAKQQQQPLPKFNYPTNQVNGSNVADAAAAALPSDSTNIQIIEAKSINNKTYVTNVVANSPPVSRHHHHHHNSNNKAGEPDENSFLNSVLLSPSSHQNPIASSTILGQTGLFHQAKQQMEFSKRLIYSLEISFKIYFANSIFFSFKSIE